MNNREKLMLLRVQLYSAMQILKGKDLEDFWILIDEINSSKEMFNPTTQADGGNG